MSAIAITEPGVYPMPADVYHADPCPEPSLSSGIAKLLLDRSPSHAWFHHPRLNPDFAERHRRTFDIGRAAHAVLLGDEKRFAVIDAPDYRSKAAREDREAAYAAGKVPLLAAEWNKVTTMAFVARHQLDRHAEAADAFRDGKPEQALIWREGPIWCRALLDWMPAEGPVFYDYKTTSASAHPDAWGQRQLFDIGADIQAAFYSRGIRAVLGIERPRFRFVVQETEEPYCLAVVELAPEVAGVADRKVRRAIKQWAWCLEHDRWPGYPNRVCYIEMPLWAEKRWLEREEREQAMARRGEDVFRTAIDWQAPVEGAAE